jgi:hypothetical protein
VGENGGEVVGTGERRGMAMATLKGPVAITRWGKGSGRRRYTCLLRYMCSLEAGEVRKGGWVQEWYERGDGEP